MMPLLDFSCGLMNGLDKQPGHVVWDLNKNLFFLDGIVSHLKKQAGPASVELKSEEELMKFIGDRDASVVGEHIFDYLC